MATNFPTSLDSLTNPTSTDTLASPSHSGQHADANDAIEALEAKVGVDGSAVTTSHSYKIAGLEGKQYVTLASDSQLSSERVLTAGTGITVTDAGAGSTVTVATSAILPTVVDAKGDLIAGTANDTVARVAVGSNNQVLTADSAQTAGVKWATPVTVATDTLWDAKGDLAVGSGADTAAKLTVGSNGDMLVADSSATSGLRWQGQTNAGRNAIINGGFDVWQRGTSFSTNGAYSADRWVPVAASGQTLSISRQSFTVGNPISGYEPAYFYRIQWAGTPSGAYWLTQKVEDVRTFAGQTVTLSFWAKASSSTSALNPGIEQNFGTGGSSVVTTSGSAISLTTSWQRFSVTLSVPSISGKTVGTNSYLEVRPFVGSTSVNGIDVDIWGVQLEAGSVATRFEELPYGETLRKCQRYYFLLVSGNAKRFSNGNLYNSTILGGVVHFPVTMRTDPTMVVTTGTDYYIVYRNNGNDTFNSLTIQSPCTNATGWDNQTEISGTAGHAGVVATNNASASVAFSAEL